MLYEVITVDNSGHENNSTNNDSTTFSPQTVKGFSRPGGIALSWDDTGHIVTCYQYLSIFQKYNATCTMNVNKLSNSKIPPETMLYDLNALHEAGWEIAAHGYNHTNSVTFLSTNTPTEWLNQEIFPNIVEITCYGYPVSTLAYPFSDRNPTTDAIVAPYFRTRITSYNVCYTKLLRLPSPQNLGGLQRWISFKIISCRSEPYSSFY